MKIVSICHMFPNSVNRNLGVFVKERLLHVAKKVNLIMIAPVPSFPFIERTKKYAGYKSIQLQELYDGLIVLHPRYFMIPKYLKFLDASFYEMSLRSCIKNTLAKTDCQVLDVHWVYPDGFAALDWARRYNKKVVVTVRGNEALHYYQDTVIRKMIVSKMHLFDHVISVSDDLKNKLINEYNVSPDKITVIHNGVDKAKFAPMDKSVARSKCGFTENFKYILAISRLSSEKGLEFLFEAIARLKTDKVKLVIIGDGPLYAYLNEFVVSKHLSDKIHFVGSVPHNDLCAWYNAVDVFCLSSLWEGCPNVVIEALSCGTPVVSSSVGAVPHFVNDICGSLVPPGDADSLAKALDKVLNTAWDQKTVSRNPSLREWGDVADDVIDVFRKILNKFDKYSDG